MSREVGGGRYGLRSRGLLVLSTGRSPQGRVICRLLRQAMPWGGSGVRRRAPKLTSSLSGGGGASGHRLAGPESSCSSPRFAAAS